jgi:hypothetical protein
MVRTYRGNECFRPPKRYVDSYLLCRNRSFFDIGIREISAAVVDVRYGSRPFNRTESGIFWLRREINAYGEHFDHDE